MNRRALAVVAALLLGAVAAAEPIPPRPTTDQFLWDYAGLIVRSDEAAIAGLQTDAFNRYNSPLVVVTIGRAADYGEPTVEALARRWFDTWQIGTLGLEGGANQGMLLLVAVQDRRARIELGADWGHDWDDHAKRIMDGTIIPKFRTGDYSGGIAAGVRELHAMAKLGKNSRPPGDFLDRKVKPLCKYSLLDPTPFLVMMGLGLVVTILGVYPRFNAWVFFSGIGLMLFAAFSYVVLVLLFLVFGRGRGGRSSGGGGYSGGFSGGGGASGSW